MHFDAIIFDFDGVIADSEVVANTILAEQITALGLPTTYEEALATYCGLQWSHCVEIIEDRMGKAIPEDFLPEFYALARARHIEVTQPITGVAEFIENHAHRGRAVASSNDRNWLLASLDRLTLAHCFGEHVYSGADMARGKPHPDIYLHAADRLAVGPQRTLVIEDSPTGVAAGAAAGMTVAGFLGGSHIRDGHAERLHDAGAHHLAADYAALEALIGELET